MKSMACSIEGCERKLYARHRCRGHYNQLIRSEIREPIHCKFCGELFMPKSSVRKHCYQSLCERERNNETVREFYSRERAAGVSKWQREKGRDKRYQRVCRWCGEGYPTAKPRQKYCSPECAGLSRQGGPRTRAGELAVYVAPQVKPESSRPVFIASACKVCDARFITFRADDYCSSSCRLEFIAGQRRNTRDTYHARKRGVSNAEAVDRIKVFEADGYRCHICKHLTDPTTTFPHPRYPTIDHIVPISLGGQHSQENCATACHGCNLRKNATGVGDQLRLFSYV